MKYLQIISVLFLLTLYGSDRAYAQATLTGSVRDGQTGEPVEFASIYIKGTNTEVQSDNKGSFSIQLPAAKPLTLIVSRLGYKDAKLSFQGIEDKTVRRIEVDLVPLESKIEIEIKESRIRDKGMIRENVEPLKYIPTASGNFETILPHIALGTSSGSGGELTSQYNVRGGNYDENLVYVNDFEIYRPQLIRNGQQEGLSFPNLDLTQDLSFSSGGFESRYGDKLSSVLDIRYKKPDKFRASAMASLLGASGHIEGSYQIGKKPYQKLRYLIGARYKTNKYLLNSLDVTGEYSPNFTDLQGYLTYNISKDLSVELIGNFNKSKYKFIPNSRETAFGFVNYALKLFASFEGQEVDDFTTHMIGSSLTYVPDRLRNPYFLKLLVSTYQSNENERFDLLADYRLSEIETDLGKDNIGKEVRVLGSGLQHQFARNYLKMRVVNLEHKGGIELQPVLFKENIQTSHFLQWGIKGQGEFINDKINDWERIDSAGYSAPYDENYLRLFRVLKSENQLNSFRVSGYIQDTWSWKKDSVADIEVSVGLRSAYWTLNQEAFVTPRFQILYKPLKPASKQSFKLSGGLYYQPPFYRELRNSDGLINDGLLSQKSAHVVLGYTSAFTMGKITRTKFKFTAEAYYKRLWDMVSYDIDNVKIRYSGLNDSKGYIVGLDMRLNGEFVPNAESWINLSILRAREYIVGVDHLRTELNDQGEAVPVVVKDVPRPSDQFLTLSMFFQDYLPRNENFKMHMNFTFGTGLPFGIPEDNIVYRNQFRFKPYHRIDIGFSVLLWDEKKRATKPHHPLRFSKNAWLSLEVFNLMEVANPASNTWIRTVFNSQYAVPNYLTSRRINLRVRFEF